MTRIETARPTAEEAVAAAREGLAAVLGSRVVGVDAEAMQVSDREYVAWSVALEFENGERVTISAGPHTSDEAELLVEIAGQTPAWRRGP